MSILVGYASRHGLKDATAFVMSNRDLLAHRPVWLFSTGPLGTDVTDAREWTCFRCAVGPDDRS